MIIPEQQEQRRDIRDAVLVVQRFVTERRIASQLRYVHSIVCRVHRAVLFAISSASITGSAGFVM